MSERAGKTHKRSAAVACVLLALLLASFGGAQQRADAQEVDCALVDYNERIVLRCNENDSSPGDDDPSYNEAIGPNNDVDRGERGERVGADDLPDPDRSSDDSDAGADDGEAADGRGDSDDATGSDSSQAGDSGTEGDEFSFDTEPDPASNNWPFIIGTAVLLLIGLLLAIAARRLSRNKLD